MKLSRCRQGRDSWSGPPVSRPVGVKHGGETVWHHWTASLLNPEPFCIFGPIDKCCVENLNQLLPRGFTDNSWSSCLKPSASRDAPVFIASVQHVDTNTKWVRTPLNVSPVAEIKVAALLSLLLFTAGLTSLPTSISWRTTSLCSAASLQPADESESVSFCCDNGQRWSLQSHKDSQCFSRLQQNLLLLILGPARWPRRRAVVAVRLKYKRRDNMEMGK